MTVDKNSIVSVEIAVRVMGPHVRRALKERNISTVTVAGRKMVRLADLVGVPFTRPFTLADAKHFSKHDLLLTGAESKVWVSVEEASTLARCHPSTLKYHYAHGNIRGRQIAGTLFLRREEVSNLKLSPALQALAKANAAKRKKNKQERQHDAAPESMNPVAASQDDATAPSERNTDVPTNL